MFHVSENLLIGCDGYLVVVDFGFAKIIDVEANEKTFTLCGSAEYLAPEVIVRRGHDCSVDYWSLGIIVYELMFGSTPFYSEDHRDIFKNILKGDIVFPEAFTSTDGSGDPLNLACVNLIVGLLDEAPSLRLGARLGGIADIVDHTYFDATGFDWDKLSHRQVEPPFVPTLAQHGVVALESDSESDSDLDDGNAEKKGASTSVWEKTWSSKGTEEEWKDW